MRIRTIHLTFLFLILFCPLAQAFQLRGMDQPESFIVDPATGIYYVSNIVGSHNGKDNKAFIAKIDASGKLIDRHFISGGKNGVTLNAPKGLAISGNDLYVADIDTVRRFDKESGKLLGTIDLALLGAKFLNGLALGPEGQLFVSDTTGNVIFKIDPANNFQVTILAKGPGLDHPKGMVYETLHQRLLVATGGSGKIIAVDMQGNILTVFQGAFKGLDGIDLDRQGNMIVSSFTAGKIYRIKKYSTVEVLRKNLVTPADISIDHKNNQVLVPSVDGNLVFTFPLK
ncbi:MAG: hypothetical protein IIB72_10925 [Proteobacteria bacterium]|nr:hypothetical protein [Pseudomonadota bacterium]